MLNLSTLPHECIILDMCCIITLHASGQMESILKAATKQITVAAYVHEVEAVKIDLTPFIRAGLIAVVSPTEAEEVTAVNYAVSLEDGEAFTGAIAYHRNWAIATDERKALNYFTRNASQLSRVTTPDFIYYWVEQDEPTVELIRTVVQGIQIEGHYIPRRSHPLREWWDTFS